MKVVSWNIHRCIGTDGKYRPERILAVLRSFNADIIALQEIDSSLRTQAGEDQLSYFARELRMDSVMGPTLHRDYGAYGNALLTRYKITAFEEHDLSYRRFEPRGALAVSLEVAGQPLRVINTHLGLKAWERSFQIDRLLAELVWVDGYSESYRVLVLGDFNEWFPFSSNNVRLSQSFAESSPRVATFPALWPRFALDRIFASGSVKSVAYDVPRTPETRIASDHLPLTADLDFA